MPIPQRALPTVVIRATAGVKPSCLQQCVLHEHPTWDTIKHQHRRRLATIDHPQPVSGKARWLLGRSLVAYVGAGKMKAVIGRDQKRLGLNRTEEASAKHQKMAGSKNPLPQA